MHPRTKVMTIFYSALLYLAFATNSDLEFHTPVRSSAVHHVYISASAQC